MPRTRPAKAPSVIEDKYRDFADLATHERDGVDYQIRLRSISTTMILAPHAGGIEPGTSELADAIAGTEHSFYAFEGLKRTRNIDLHITSARFDEPQCLAMLAQADRVVTIHGEQRSAEVVFLGGLDDDGIASIRASLTDHGFTVQPADSPHLAGRARNNICNRGRTGAGVQLEIADGLRRTFFRALTPRSERQRTTAAFTLFVNAVRAGLPWPQRPARPPSVRFVRRRA